MLDLTKPVRFVGNYFRAHYDIKQIFKSTNSGSFIVEYVDNNGGRVCQAGTFKADRLENIPEPKVATDFLAVYRKDTGDIYLSRAYQGSHLPKAKITYTEGAENPWQIEEIKP